MACGGCEDDVDDAVGDDPAIEAKRRWLLFGGVFGADLVGVDAMLDSGTGFEFAGKHLEDHDGTDFLGDSVRFAGVEAFESVPELEFPEGGLDAPPLGVEGDEIAGRMLLLIAQRGEEDGDGPIGNGDESTTGRP